MVVAIAVMALGAGMLPIGAEAATSSPGVEDNRIVVGGLGGGHFYGPGEIGARARFERANRDGGVHGRSIDLVQMVDDHNDPAASAVVAQQLLDEDHVFAVVPLITAHPDAGALLEEQGVPFFGYGISEPFCDGEWGFAFNGCTNPSGGSISFEATWVELISSQLGSKPDDASVAIISEATDSGRLGVARVKEFASRRRLNVVYADSPLPPPPNQGVDYSGFARTLLTSADGGPPDAVFLVCHTPDNPAIATAAAMMHALQGAGYAGIATTSNVWYRPDVASNVTGLTIFTEVATPESASANSSMQQVIDDVEAVAPGELISLPLLFGYFSADLFVEALDRAGQDLTRASVRRAANRLRYGLEDTVGPTQFPRARRRFSGCGQLVRSTGTKFEIVSGFRCVQSATTGHKREARN